MDKTKIKEYIIKLNGEVSILDKVDIEKTYDVAFRGDIKSAELKDNDDGTYYMIYKIRPTGEIIINDAGKRISGKTKGSKSQKVRFALYSLFSELNIDGEFEDFYDKFYDKLRANLEKVYEFLRGEK